MNDRKKIVPIVIAALFVTLAAVASLPQAVAAGDASPRLHPGDILVLGSTKAEAITKVGEAIVRKPVTIELKITVTAVEGKTVRFRLDSGSITIDSVNYNIASGKGGLVRREGKGILILGGEVKGSNNVSGAFRLEGVAGIADGRVGSLFRGGIKVGQAAYRLRGVLLISRA